jgi:hypothetical protein
MIPPDQDPDTPLRTLLRSAGAADERAAPPFQRTWSGARHSGRPAARWKQVSLRLGLGAAACSLALALALRPGAPPSLDTPPLQFASATHPSSSLGQSPSDIVTAAAAMPPPPDISSLVREIDTLLLQ